MKDKIGNEIKEGDLVEVTVAFPGNVIGRITNIKRGGAIMMPGQRGDQPNMTPHVIEVQVIMPVISDPASPTVQGVLKCFDPNPPQPAKKVSDA